MFFMVLLSTIIYICIILYYRIYHKFWFHQPVDFLFTLDTELGKIKTIDYVHKYNTNYTCSEWNNKNDIIEFLNENFNPQGEIYSYSDYTCNNSIVFKVQQNNTQEIVGCISVKPIELYIEDKHEIVYYVDHLNIKDPDRGKGLAPDLISFVVDSIGDKTYLFKKDIHPLPFKYFCKYEYHLVLDPAKGNILPEISESIDLDKTKYTIFSPPTKDCVILEKENKKAIIYYTNILDIDEKPIFEIGYVEDEYIAQLSVNYIRVNFPDSKILVNNLSDTAQYFDTKYLSENYLYLYNYRVTQVKPRDIFLVCP